MRRTTIRALLVLTQAHPREPRLTLVGTDVLTERDLRRLGREERRQRPEEGRN